MSFLAGWMNVSEAARLFGVARRTIYRRIEAGAIPPEHVKYTDSETLVSSVALAQLFGEKTLRSSGVPYRLTPEMLFTTLNAHIEAQNKHAEQLKVHISQLSGHIEQLNVSLQRERDRADRAEQRLKPEHEPTKLA